MSTSSDGPGRRHGEQPVTQTGRPPVPRAVPPDADEPREDDGVQRTEQVPFPLPPLPSGSPPPVGGPPTGQLSLGDYPPRVPGGPGRGRPDDGADRGDPDGGRPDRSDSTGGDPDERGPDGR